MSTSDSDCWLDISNTATRSRISRDGPSGGVPALMLAAALALGAQEAKAQGVFHCPAASPPAAASFPKGFDHRLITKDHLQAVYRASLPSIRAVRRLVTLTEPVECGFVDDGHRNVVVRNPRITSTQDYVPGIYRLASGQQRRSGGLRAQRRCDGCPPALPSPHQRRLRRQDDGRRRIQRRLGIPRHLGRVHRPHGPGRDRPPRSVAGDRGRPRRLRHLGLPAGHLRLRERGRPPAPGAR